MFVVGNFPTTREHKHKHKPKGPDSAVDERVGFAKLSVFLPNSFFLSHFEKFYSSFYVCLSSRSSSCFFWRFFPVIHVIQLENERKVEIH